jgi:hypothetical protein
LQHLIGYPEHAAHTQIHPDVSNMARIRINPSSRVSPCHKRSVEIAVIMSDVNYEQRAEVCRSEVGLGALFWNGSDLGTVGGAASTQAIAKNMAAPINANLFHHAQFFHVLHWLVGRV